MSDESDERRKRLKALKEKASKNIKFRNYRPQDAKLKEKASDNSSSTSGDGNKRSNEQGLWSTTCNTESTKPPGLLESTWESTTQLVYKLVHRNAALGLPYSYVDLSSFIYE